MSSDSQVKMNHARTLVNRIKRATKNGVVLAEQENNMAAARKKLSLASAVNKRIAMEGCKGTIKFYDRKAREPKGGAFYMVKYAGKILGTYWGKSAIDVSKQMNKSRTRYDSISALA